MKGYVYDVTAEDQDSNLIQFEVVLNDYATRTAFEYACDYFLYLGKDSESIFISSCQLCHSEQMELEIFQGRDYFIRPRQGCR